MKSQAAALLQMVSRFHLGKEQPVLAAVHRAPAPPVAAPEVPVPQPIPVKPAAKLPPLPHDALSAPPLKAAANGEWKEF